MGKDPVSSTVRAVELGLRLRARREQLGLTAAAVGKLTGIGGNNVSSIEIAKRKLTSAKLADLAQVYELSAEELAELDQLRAQTERREWWDDYARLYSDEFLRFIGLEAGATSVREYAAELVPGLLQTADYARAVMRGASAYIRPVEVGPRVEARLARQARLEGHNRLRLSAIIGQTALHQEVGDRATMRRQLEHLIHTIETKRDHIDIRVMPYSAGAHPLLGGTLQILSFASPWVPDMVWLDSVTTIVGLIDRRQTTLELTASFEESLHRALDPDATHALIHQTHQEMETP